MGVELPEDVVYCEMCGKAIDRKKAKTIFIEGALLKVCEECYSKVMAKKAGMQLTVASKPSVAIRSSPQLQISRKITSIPPQRAQTRRISQQRIFERFELVEDYAVRIRQARERLGWSTKVLAMKVKESESTIKRIESGKLRPTIELARRLEEVLGIKLLVPIIDEGLSFNERKRVSGVTLGEIVNIREE